MRRPAYSLVEVLVVLAVVGALVGLALPAVQRARAAAGRARDANELRQIGVALHGYHADRGHLPPDAEFPDSRSCRNWYGTVRDDSGVLNYPPELPPTDPADGILAPNLGPNPGFADPARGAGYKASSGRHTGGHGYNSWHLSPRVATGLYVPVTLPHVATTSRTLAFVNSALVLGRIEDPYVDYSFGIALPPSRGGCSVHFRHSGVANVLWLDGHVEGWAERAFLRPHDLPAILALRERAVVHDIAATDELWDVH